MLNLTKLFEKQIVLEQAIFNLNRIQDRKSIRLEQIVALIVELAELANEYESFKYWKKSKKNDRAKMIEEFVDGLHLLISIGIEFKIEPKVNPLVVANNQNQQLYATFKAIIDLGEKYDIPSLNQVLSLYFGIAEQLSFTFDEIIQAYMIKNDINLQRLANNY